MIDIKKIRKEPDHIKEALSIRNDNPDLVDQILALDAQRREWVAQTDALKAERNTLSQLVAKQKAENKSADVSHWVEKSKAIGDQIKANDERLAQLESQQQAIVSLLPNIPSDKVPRGTDENHNVEVRRWGEPRVFDFEPLPHWDLGSNLNMMDFERASKLSGSRFVVLKGQLSRLERAIASLPEGYRDVVVLHDVEGHTHEDIGRMLGIEAGTSKSQLSRGRRALRQLLGHGAPTAGPN